MVFCTGFLALSEMIRPFMTICVINLLKNSGPDLSFSAGREPHGRSRAAVVPEAHAGTGGACAAQTNATNHYTTNHPLINKLILTTVTAT